MIVAGVAAAPFTLTATVRLVPATEAGLLELTEPARVKAAFLITFAAELMKVSVRLGGLRSTPKVAETGLDTFPATSVACALIV